jgi:hypothetical protein
MPSPRSPSTFSMTRWSTGAGRRDLVGEPPPYSVAELVEFLKQWEAAGAPCPTNKPRVEKQIWLHAYLVRHWS